MLIARRQWAPALFSLLIQWILVLAIPCAGKGEHDEPRADWSPQAAARYLDERGEWWLAWSGAARGQGTACISCHTSLSIALARPALGELLGETEPSAAQKRLIDTVKKRVEIWDEIAAGPSSIKDRAVPYYADKKDESLGTEAVLNTLLLVNDDAQWAKGVLSPTTEKALRQLWAQQQEDGSWPWLDFGLNPWENDGAYYGASLAALAVGTAGRTYFERGDVREKVAALTNYLNSEHTGQPLHHRTLALLASSRLTGILTGTTRELLVGELLEAQEPDGGWSLPRLGQSGSRPADKAWHSRGASVAGAVSDGYATGLVMLALKRAGVAADDPRLRRGLDWLRKNQADGTWPAHYLNKQRDPQDDAGKFMRDAATAFAILALTEK